MRQQYIGTLDWARRTGGALSLKEQFALLSTVLVPTLANVSCTWLRIGKAAPVSMDRIARPDTQAIKSAYSLLQSCADDTLINHSFRTYYWGAAFAAVAGLSHDPELLLASCLLHDLGMTDAYHGKCAGCNCFAVEGSMAAKAWAQTEGWTIERQDRLAEAISLHMNGHVSVENGVEAHLLQQGATCDVIGSRYYDLSEDYRASVIARYPRRGLNRQFADFVAKESRMRPQSRTSLMQLSGMGLLITANPFDE